MFFISPARNIFWDRCSILRFQQVHTCRWHQIWPAIDHLKFAFILSDPFHAISCRRLGCVPRGRRRKRVLNEIYQQIRTIANPNDLKFSKIKINQQQYKCNESDKVPTIAVVQTIYITSASSRREHTRQYSTVPLHVWKI